MNDVTLRMNSSGKSLRKYIPLILLGGLLGATTAVIASGKSERNRPAAEVKLSTDDTPVARDGQIAASFSPVVKKVSPSVVQVDTVQKGKVVNFGMVPEFPIPGFPQLFGEEGPFGQVPGRQFRTPAQRGAGSGVIVTKDGYILTNNHVVDGADELKVRTADGREFKATVVGRDPKTDIAVIQVEATDLPAIAIADSEKIEVGDLVLAVGNPFGLGQTVTMGMVSATGRATRELSDLSYQDFIQTDAAINPGNSGGALVDVQGRLVGINTAIFTRNGGNMGIGFAVPTKLAREVMADLISDGKVIRGYLGVFLQEITPQLAKKFKLDDQRGALVAEVAPKSPADRAGLEGGDVITQLNGKDVADSRQLRLEVARIRPGETATVKVLRGGEAKTLKAKVGQLEDDKAIAQKPSGRNDEGTLNGVTVADLDARMRRQFNVPAKVEGALVTQVEADSAAAEAGLQPGDVILEINHEKVSAADEAVKLTEGPKEKTTLLKLWSRNTTRFLVVDESGGQ
jgi:serine protease Do